MNVFKQIFLILSLFTVITPIHAMDQAEVAEQSFFGKIWNLAKEHPMITGIGVAAGLAGVYAYKNHLQNKPGKISENPLITAAREGDLIGLKTAIAEDIERNGKVYCETLCIALHIASIEDHLEIVKYLVTCGVDANTEDHYGFTAFYLASSNGNLEIVKYLLTSGADINTKYGDGWTALHMAAENGHLEIVNHLIMHGADINAKDNQGWTAVQKAMSKGNLDVVKLLVKAGADIEACDGALFNAIVSGHIDIVKLLLEKGALVKIDGTAFSFAVIGGNYDMVLALIQRSHFVTPNGNTKESQKRLQATMIASRKAGLPKVIGKKIISYMPEDLMSADHAKMVYNYSTDIKELVEHCPISWFNKMYEDTVDIYKSAFLAKVVPAIVEFRLGKVKEMLEGRTSDDPAIASIIDIDTIGQHRAAITKHVTNGILGIEEEPELVVE